MRELEISSVNGNYLANFYANIEDLVEVIIAHEDVYVLIDSEMSRLYPNLTSFETNKYLLFVFLYSSNKLINLS